MLDPLQHYLARLCWAVFAAQPRPENAPPFKLKEDDFLIEWETAKEENEQEQEPELTPEEEFEARKRASSFGLALWQLRLGMVPQSQPE